MVASESSLHVYNCSLSSSQLIILSPDIQTVSRIVFLAEILKEAMDSRLILKNIIWAAMLLIPLPPPPPTPSLPWLYVVNLLLCLFETYKI